MATQRIGDCVKQRSATHPVWANDFKSLNFDFVTRSMLVGTLCDLIFVEIIFLHQPVGEAQCGFGFSLRRVGVIGTLKNRAHLVSNAV